MKVFPLLIGANVLNYVTVTHFVQVKKKLEFPQTVIEK